MLKGQPYSHERYKKKVNKRLNKFVKQIPEHHAKVLDLLFLLDLTLLCPIVSHLYANFGAIAWAPELMFRSLIAMMLCGITSFDVWVSTMRSIPFYAIICGFHPTKVPGVGTFYDFCNRLLGLETSPPKQIRPPFGKRSRKDKSANKDKNADTKKHDGIIQKLADRIMRRPIEERQINPFALNADFSSFKRYRRVLLKIFYLIFVDNSIRLGLVDINNLNLSGDGSKIQTYANPSGKKLCDCDNRGKRPSDWCDCHRRYNDYEARWGYDSYHDCWVYGYNIYELTAYSLKHQYSLPLVVDIIPANRHDSVLSIVSMYEACNLLGFDVKVATFDAASDAKGIYQLGVEYWHTAMVIPLNPGNSGNVVNLPAKEFTLKGQPICQNGLPMTRWWYDKEKQRIKWRCPLVAVKSMPDVKNCPFASACSPSDYGRVIYTYPSESYRHFTVIQRESEIWKKHYNRHSNAENTHKRKKWDFALKETKTAGKERWFLRTILAAMCQHLNAWYDSLKN